MGARASCRRFAGGDDIGDETCKHGDNDRDIYIYVFLYI
jgi:hypothetical protein